MADTNNDAAAAPAAQPAAGGEKEPMAGYPGMLSAEKKDINGGNTTLIFAAPVSDKIVMAHYASTMLMPCTCMLCHSKELQKASYVHLFEDRIEYNFSSSICCTIVDNPQVLYLDRDVAELQTVPDCCRPIFTHCTCCPTMWDLSGEVVMMHGENHCCFHKGGKPFSMMPNIDGCPQILIGRPMPCLNRQWVYIPFLDDGVKLKQEIRKVRNKLVADGRAQQLTGTKPAAQSRE